MAPFLLPILAPLGACISGSVTKGGAPPLKLSQPRTVNATQNGGVFCSHSTGKQEFGYVEVGKLNKYFYAAIEADVNPQDAPTFLYLQGGPAPAACTPLCESMDLASWMSQGKNWRQIRFSTGPIATNLENFMLDMVDFVNEFFEKHPNFNKNVHLIGASASGSVVAMLGARIATAAQRKVDLAGVMVQGGVVSPSSILNKMAAGLPKCMDQLSKCNSNGPGKQPISVLCNQAVATCQPLVINPLPQGPCDREESACRSCRLALLAASKDSALNCVLIDIFLNDQPVQQELHVSKTWTPSNKDVLVVNGDQDYVTNAIGSLDWMLNLKGILNYGEQLKQVPAKTVQGATIKALKYSNAAKLAFIEVTNAGHSVTVYDPSAMQREVEAFLTGQLWESA
ncbi:hypothetical protein FOL46_005818 [Perkinsus olseni]|uniref:Uncharacterized protein n=1 Tax=Perkinsus olseni TaxID=32597 RepID=A0A7J6LPP5_PEROL|nr:hypothetical protein FOL46_005818 [Perkinsus olseni]